jgi:hypothetical protein
VLFYSFLYLKQTKNKSILRNKSGYIKFILLGLFCVLNSYSQGEFRLINNIKKQSIPFKLLNNLIVFQMDVNGRELNFILYSGVGSTILFNLDKEDSSMLNNVKKVKLKGLGSEDPVDGFLSEGNEFRFNNMVGRDQNLYVLSNDSFDLSSKLGITVHGIIGYEILKDMVVKISYGLKKITFYNDRDTKAKKCKKCESFDLEFFKSKPYVNVQVRLQGNSDKVTPVKLLIDSGGSDALWLFEGSHTDIESPVKYFDDFLGEGLSGAVYGKRSYVSSLHLGKFELEHPTVSYPDSASISFARNFEERNGSLGGNILKRFMVIFDYKNKRISLKKGRFFKIPFGYNMSGMELVYNGKRLVREKSSSTSNKLAAGKSNDRNPVFVDFSYKYIFKPSYRVHKLRIGSPAHKAGLLEGDILIKINEKYAHDMELETIINEFSKKENYRISVVIERAGKNYNFKFKLEDHLK